MTLVQECARRKRLLVGIKGELTQLGHEIGGIKDLKQARRAFVALEILWLAFRHIVDLEDPQ